MFKSQNFCHIASNNRNNVKAGMFIYRTTDDLATVTANGYFNERIIDLNLHDIIVHEQIDNADPTKVKQNFLCVVQKTLTNVNTKIMDTDEVDGANTDLDNLSDTGKANISAEGTYDANASYDAGTVGAAIQSKADAATSANTDLSNLTSTGANISNWSSNVTNCITEIPQDIKLELNNGTLTLKAGSKVYVPNGDGVFEEKTFTSMATRTSATSGSRVGIALFDKTTLNFVQLFDVARAYACSGTTDTLAGTPYHLWYDTTNNAIKYYGPDGTTNNYYCSLPIAMYSGNGTRISSIDQVFNGFGYIGSTVFALPGVKCLIPDGRNADGSLKNTDVVLNQVLTKNYTYQISNGYIFLANNDVQVGPKSAFLMQDDQPTIGASFERWFSPKENQEYYHTAGGTEWIKANNYLIIGNCNISGSPLRVSLFQPKTAFHAVDYNDTVYIANQAMPSERYANLTLPATGGTITAPADGYLTVNKSATAADQYINFINGSNGMNCNAIATSALPLRLCMAVSKGDVITINYDAAGTTTMFRFIYANGSK